MEVNQKLWNQSDSEIPDWLEKFTIGNDRKLDVFLAPFDVLASLAHAKMLNKCGYLTNQELAQIEKGFEKIRKLIDDEEFCIGDGVEDVHSQIELMLIEFCGETGKKIHTARSRNDQVLAAMKLYLLDRLDEIHDRVKSITLKFLEKSNQHQSDLLPGYTHMQVAMPSSFGLWFSAYAESLTQDLIFVRAAREMISSNPLGSAAGYGTSLKIDREFTTNLLPFSSLNENVVYAQMTRGKSERNAAYAMAGIASSLAKFCMDCCLYFSQELNFISLPSSFTTGSSIMPHKKNPDVFELLRAQFNRVQSLPNEIQLLLQNLPSGYHRDFQVCKDMIIPAIENFIPNLSVLEKVIPEILIRKDILSDEKYKYVFSVEKLNQMVLSGIPFRDAYREIAREIASNRFSAPEVLSDYHPVKTLFVTNSKIRRKLSRPDAIFE